MQLVKLRLKNFCQYIDSEINFSPYMNLLVGQNGAGKTNLFRAVLFLLTGNAGGECNKDENIRLLSDVNEPAFVSGTFVHKGHTYNIQRSLRNSSTFFAEGRTLATTISGVNTAVYDTFGITERLLKDYVFVQQRCVDAWINKPPRERTLDWEALFGLNKAETIYKKLGEAKSKIEVAAPVEDLVTLNNELSQCQDSIAKVETTLSRLIDIPDDITEYVSTRLEFINGIKKVEQNRLAAKDWLDGVKLLISDWRARARFPAGLGAVAAVITTDCATAALDYHHVYQSLTRIRQLKASLLGSNPLLDFCPTCGQAWPEAKKEEFKLKLANYTEEEKQYETECNAKREYKELVDVYTEAHNEVMKARAHLKSQILFYKKKKSTLKFDMSTSVEDQTAAVEKAEAEIFVMRDAFSLKTKAKEQLLVLKNQEKYIFESLNKFKAYEKKYYKSKEIGTKLDSLRDIFHYDNLPKQIAFAYLDKIQSRVNEVLTLFNAPFRAMPDENMGFICKFADGSLFTDKRLSGGQKVVLGLAVRMAVNALFVGHLGMMILDEPSEGLDEHNLGCLPYALEKLADICKSNDMQVLFVTHMDRLSYLFDNIVNIGEETKL